MSVDHPPDHLNTAQGLTTAQARVRLAQDGPNEADQSTRRSVWRRLTDTLRQPMFALLVTAALLYLLLGDLAEGLTLSVFVLAVLGLSFYQEGRSEAAIEALRQLTQAQARLLRGGQIQQIPTNEVVAGDSLLLSGGDRVAADGWLLQANYLRMDESLLTGESVAMDKRPLDLLPGGDLSVNTPTDSCVYGGTWVVPRNGRLRVTSTGMHSQLVHTYALSPSLKAMSHVWQFGPHDPHVVSAKWAPEAIMDLCHLSPDARLHWLACVADMAAQGLRVLAVAHSRFDGPSYPDSPHDFDFM